MLHEHRLALREAGLAALAASVLRRRRRSRRKPHRIAAPTSSSVGESDGGENQQSCLSEDKVVEGDIVVGSNGKRSRRRDQSPRQRSGCLPQRPKGKPASAMPTIAVELPWPTEDTKARIVATITPVSTSTRLR